LIVAGDARVGAGAAVEECYAEIGGGGVHGDVEAVGRKPA